MEDLEIESTLAKKLISASLAFPSTGGDCTFIFMQSPCRPKISDFSPWLQIDFKF